jgi:hypothetical protein
VRLVSALIVLTILQSRPQPKATPRSSDGLRRKSAVYGLNGRRAHFVIALSLVTYEHAIYKSRSFTALFSRTLTTITAIHAKTGRSLGLGSATKQLFHKRFRIEFAQRMRQLEQKQACWANPG